MGGVHDKKYKAHINYFTLSDGQAGLLPAGTVAGINLNWGCAHDIYDNLAASMLYVNGNISRLVHRLYN
jgi:hypothetical protein